MHNKLLFTVSLISFFSTTLAHGAGIRRVWMMEAVSEGAVTNGVHKIGKVWERDNVVDTWAVRGQKPFELVSSCPNHPTLGDDVTVFLELGKVDFAKGANWSFPASSKAILTTEEVQSIASGNIRIDVRIAGTHTACPNGPALDAMGMPFGGMVWASCTDVMTPAGFTPRGQGYEFDVWETSGYYFDDTVHLNFDTTKCTEPLRVFVDVGPEQQTAAFDIIEVTIFK